MLSLSIAVVGWGVARIVRFNLLGYFLLATLLSLSGSVLELVRQPNSFFRWNGYFAVAFGIILLAWPLVAWLRYRNAPPPVGEPPLSTQVAQ